VKSRITIIKVYWIESKS